VTLKPSPTTTTMNKPSHASIAGTPQPIFGMHCLAPLALACVLLLGGCAAQNAYREGRELMSAGRRDAALTKFEEAARTEPSSVQYRMAVMQAREAMLQEHLNNAQQALVAENYPVAQAAFERVLVVQANHPKAQEGLRFIEARSRHLRWLTFAETEIGKGEYKQAGYWLRLVVAEDPNSRKALALQQLIDTSSEKPTASIGLSDTYKNPISIEFKDASLKSVFEVIARTSGMNFLFDKDVRTDQKTSIFLKNSTIEAAVNLTLLTNQLEQRVLDANTVLIYPNTQAKQRDYQPLTVKTFYLVNAEAKTVANTLKTILRTRDVVVDDKLNMIIMRDSAESIRMAEKLVALHDVAEPEVMLEVEILEVKRTRLLDLGIRWPDQLSLSPISATAGVLTVAELRNINSTTLGATLGPTTIQAKKVDTDANILANPRIRARNREKAKILIGERVPNITSTATSTGFVSESVNYVDVGLKLDVEPTIYPDGEVAIKVALEVSNIINQLQTKSGSIAYQIGTRTAQTVLRLKDGENQVLAGLINDEDRRTANKVPGLGEVPVVGRLFGNQADDTSKTEIVLSITPRILRNIQRPAASIIEFDSGTESSLGVRPAAGGSITSNPPTPPNRPANTAPAGLPAPGANTSNLNPSATPQVTQATTPPIAATPATISNPLPLATGTALSWLSPTQLRVGDSFAVQLSLQSEQGIVSLPMSIGFDTRVIQIMSITEGDFLKQGGAPTSFTSRVDPTGQILITGTRVGDTGASNTGSVATLNLRVLAAPDGGETRLQLLTLTPAVVGGRSISASLPPPLVIKINP
jgi:general secretion pathway protein D